MLNNLPKTHFFNFQYLPLAVAALSKYSAQPVPSELSKPDRDDAETRDALTNGNYAPRHWDRRSGSSCIESCPPLF